MDSSQSHSNNQHMQNQQVSFNSKPNLNNQRTYGPSGALPFQVKDMNSAFGMQQMSDMQNHQIQPNNSTIIQGKLHASDNLQRTENENFQSNDQDHNQNKLNFGYLQANNNQRNCPDDQTRKDQFNFKSTLMQQANCNQSLSISVAETQNDSMEVQNSNSSNSEQSRLRPRLEQIFESSKRALPGQKQVHQQQIQPNTNNPFSKMLFTQNSMTNQTMRSIRNQRINQNQSNNQNTMGTGIFKPLSRVVNISSSMFQQTSSNAVKDRGFDSPPSKRTFQNKPNKNNQRVAAINQSPLIADYRTQHISYEGLQTPMNLISPPKNADANPRLTNQTQEVTIEQRLFSNDCDIDENMDEDVHLSIGKGISQQEDSQTGPTDATSNLHEVQRSAQSILNCIYQDQEDQVQVAPQMKRKLFNEDFENNQIQPGLSSQLRPNIVENSGIVNAINAADRVGTNIESENADRLWSQNTNLQLQAPSVLKSHATRNIGIGFSQMNLNQMDKQIQDQQINIYENNQSNQMVNDENEINTTSHQREIQVDSLKFNVCPAKQQPLMLKPCPVKKRLQLFNDLPSVQQLNHGATGSRYTIQPQMLPPSQSSSHLVETVLASENNEYRQGQYVSSLQQNKSEGQHVQPSSKRSSKKRPLEVLYQE